MWPLNEAVVVAVNVTHGAQVVVLEPPALAVPVFSVVFTRLFYPRFTSRFVVAIQTLNAARNVVVKHLLRSVDGLHVGRVVFVL